MKFCLFSKSNRRLFGVALAASLPAILFVSLVPLVFSEPLPSFTIPCRTTTYGESWVGDYAFGLFQNNPSHVFVPVASYLVIMDSEVNLLHLREWAGSSYQGEVSYIAPGTLLFQGEGGSYVHFWNFSSGNVTDFDAVEGHHDVDYNPINNTVLTLNNYVREVNGTSYLFDTIVEYNATGSAVWVWDTYDHIPLSQQSVYNLTSTVDNQTVVDFTHANSLQWYYNESIVYFNCRHTNTFYKINQTTGDLIWSCGEFGDFTLLDAQGNQVESLWYGCHDVKQVEPNVFIMFNNDFGNVTDFNNEQSAMQEVTINEQDMTAYVSWSWTAPKELYSAYWGETARLPNGNRIGVFGTLTHPLAQTTPYLVNDTGAVLVEVNPQGELVKLYEFPHGWGIYRIEPLPVRLNPTPSPTATVTPTTNPALGGIPTMCIYAILASVVVAFVIVVIMLYGRTKKEPEVQ
ncbi:MAG: aryl-sulfate sulfotransferase [Candidatus Bathyarchaeota archaeon]|nr:aryl-sulfate sulfotransferase [Candidatus Bathyarchaeota archaeon]